MNKNKHLVRHKVLLIVGVILVAAVAILGLELTNTIHLFHKSAIVRPPSKPITSLPSSPSTQPTTPVKSPSSTPSSQPGAPTDQNGKAVSNTPSSPNSWSTSQSGVITVKLPSANQKIQPGATLTGTASVSQVQYRLTDDQVGVISEGPVNVVNGTFTANINFNSKSTSGRLDVFTADAAGRELNEVQIPVNF